MSRIAERSHFNVSYTAKYTAEDVPLLSGKVSRDFVVGCRIFHNLRCSIEMVINAVEQVSHKCKKIWTDSTTFKTPYVRLGLVRLN